MVEIEKPEIALAGGFVAAHLEDEGSPERRLWLVIPGDGDGVVQAVHVWLPVDLLHISGGSEGGRDCCIRTLELFEAF